MLPAEEMRLETLEVTREEVVTLSESECLREALDWPGAILGACDVAPSPLRWPGPAAGAQRLQRPSVRLSGWTLDPASPPDQPRPRAECCPAVHEERLPRQLEGLASVPVQSPRTLVPRLDRLWLHRLRQRLPLLHPFAHSGSCSHPTWLEIASFREEEKK